MDHERSQILALLGQENHQASVGAAFLGTADPERNDHVLQQQFIMAIVDNFDQALPLLSLRPDQHDIIGY